MRPSRNASSSLPSFLSNLLLIPTLLVFSLLLNIPSPNPPLKIAAMAETTTTSGVPRMTGPNSSFTLEMSQSAKINGNVSQSAAAAAASMSPPNSINAAAMPQQQQPDRKQQWYAMVLPINAVCIFLQLYVSIFGRRMRMNGLRWFTIYYNLWNIYQLVLISDSAENSPWHGWLEADRRLVTNRAALELFTMSLFPLGTIMLVPLSLLSHFCFCCPLRWIPWLALFILCSLMQIFLYNGQFSFEFPIVKGNFTISMDDGTSIEVFDAYAFVCISFAMFSVLYLIPMVFLGVFFFLCYRLLNRYNPYSKHPMRTSRMVDLILLVPYLVVILFAHLPCFVVNLASFFLVNIYPKMSDILIPMLAGSANTPGGGGGNSTSIANNQTVSIGNRNWMMNVLNTYNQIASYKDNLLMLLPLLEFVASFLFIRMYREQYLALLSCYACYKGDKEGACGLCCYAHKWNFNTVAVAPTTPVVVFPPQSQKIQGQQDSCFWAQKIHHHHTN